MRVFWTGEFVSETGGVRKDGSRRSYRTTLYDDGQAVCDCTDYIIRGRNSGNPNRRCKHIRRAAQEQPEWPGNGGAPKAPTEPAPAPPSVTGERPKIQGLTFEDIERRARRRL